MKHSLTDEVFKIVKRLNANVYASFEDYDLILPPLFELKTDGISVVVKFMGSHILWSSNNDGRKSYLLPDEDDNEPLEQYLRREAQEIINQISSIKL